MSCFQPGWFKDYRWKDRRIVEVEADNEKEAGTKAKLKVSGDYIEHLDVEAVVKNDPPCPKKYTVAIQGHSNIDGFIIQRAGIYEVVADSPEKAKILGGTLLMKSTIGLDGWTSYIVKEEQ